MTRKPSRHLLDMLASLPDPRKEKGKRHPLKAILALAIIAMMSGYRSYAGIAEYGRTYKMLRKALGFQHKKTPCAATLYNLFRRFDIDALEDVLTQWVAVALEDYGWGSQSRLTAVAIDGKTLRGSKKQGAKITHLMSVVSHELGITLTQRPMSEKTHEVPVSREILKAFDVSQKVVTADALLTQRSFSQAVLADGGDYVLPIKANHKQVYADIERLFRRPAETTFQMAYNTLKAEHQDWAETLDTFKTVDHAHGRIETRRLTASTAINEYINWPGVRQVFEYTYTRKNPKTGEVSCQTHYGITSLQPNRATAADLLRLKRGHWAIENKSHWLRDVILGEDASQVRCGAIPAVMAALRNTALSILRLAGYQAIAKTMRYFSANPKQALTLLKNDF